MIDDRQEAQIELRRMETENYYRRSEWRLVIVALALFVFNAFFQWLMGQLPDLSSEALEVVCRVLYQ